MKSKTPLFAAIIIIVIAVIIAISNSNKTEKDISDNRPSSPDQKNSPSERSSDNRPARRATTSTTLSQLEWEEKIDHVLATDTISTEKANRLLLGMVLDENAPISIRNDALEHALNLIGDQGFDKVQRVMGTGRNELPEPLVQTILDDTLNRADSIQLTTALIAIQGSHTKTIEEARELLEFHLELEHGDNVQLWQKAVNDYLAEQKKEEAAK